MTGKLLIIALALFVTTGGGSASIAQDAATSKKMLKEGAKVEVYKTTTDSEGKKVELNIYVFNPEDHKPSDSRACVVFFFGGGWKGGSPSQFTEHCKHLSSLGMVAMTADYRVASRQGTKATACVEDGKSAVRWIRSNAKKLGVDPNRVASGGGSAGGHVAACTGVIKTLDRDSEDKDISSVPNALVLFNPALVLAKLDDQTPVDAEKLKALESRIGADPKSVSPAHHVAASNPPTIIFHGKADKTVPYVTAQAFTKRMHAAGNQCELVGYEDQGHGFFNFTRKGGKYEETVAEMDKFLRSTGFLADEN